MNNYCNVVFIALLLEQDHNRNYMRIARRNLRDQLNPFEMPESHFRQMFRLDKESVRHLIDTLVNHMQISRFLPHLKVLATLNFIATGSYQNPVGNNSWISLSQSSISRSISQICELITNHLIRDWIKFPTSVEDKNQIKQGFYEKWGARGVVGVIDGTHVDLLAARNYYIRENLL